MANNFKPNNLFLPEHAIYLFFLRVGTLMPFQVRQSVLRSWIKSGHLFKRANPQHLTNAWGKMIRDKGTNIDFPGSHHFFNFLHRCRLIWDQFRLMANDTTTLRQSTKALNLQLLRNVLVDGSFSLKDPLGIQEESANKDIGAYTQRDQNLLGLTVTNKRPSEEFFWSAFWSITSHQCSPPA